MSAEVHTDLTSGLGIKVTKRITCSRCGEGTTFQISVKDAPGLWVTCGACGLILNSAIEYLGAKAQPPAVTPDPEWWGRPCEDCKKAKMDCQCLLKMASNVASMATAEYLRRVEIAAIEKKAQPPADGLRAHAPAIPPIDESAWKDFCLETGREPGSYSNVHLYCEFAEWVRAGEGSAPKEKKCE